MKILNYWKKDTFEISSYKFQLSNRINNTFNSSGSDNSGKCTYTYNELGFRGDSIKKEGFKIMSIGCSFTEGVGVNDDETWPAQISKLIKNGVNLNFGTAGRSNDFISRCLLTYFDEVKPDLVLIMYTYPHRRELYSKEGGIEPYIPGIKWGFMQETEEGRYIHELNTRLQNEYNDFNNWYRTHLLITYFLKDKNIPFLWNGFRLDNNFIDENRFDGDYDNFIDYGADLGHPGPLHNSLYSNKLYKHLKKHYSFLEI
jgi:hypothetical protein